MTGENWNEVLYDCMKVDAPMGLIFVLILFAMGNYLVINLFLAILLDNFGRAEDESKESEVLLSLPDLEASVAALAAPLGQTSEQDESSEVDSPRSNGVVSRRRATWTDVFSKQASELCTRGTDGCVDLVRVICLLADHFGTEPFLGSEAIDWLIDDEVVQTRRAGVLLAIGLLSLWKQTLKCVCCC